jgi:hypothetical protein
MVLIVPFGLLSGFLTVVLADQLNAAGVSAEAIAGLIALTYVPNTSKFLWAPVVNLTWTCRRCFLASTVITAGSLVVMD